VNDQPLGGIDMILRNLIALTAVVVWGALTAAGAVCAADDNFIIVQSTTSTQNSGLFDVILPKFKEQTGIEARVVAVGTGQALKNAQNCDGDVVFVHAKPAEEEFVQAGYGVERFDVMYNDFVIVGPRADPAKVGGLSDAPAALARIAAAKATFASRGDESGTHQKEKSLWQAAGIDPSAASGAWYRETGSGMGATLNAAAGMGAYTLTDRGTWISFENKGDLRVLVESDKALFNQYGVIRVNPEHCPNVKVEAGQKFVDWILGPDGQKAIADYQLSGQQLFFPNAKRGSS
jgi:tungstate transport system substrate-binding protein